MHYRRAARVHKDFPLVAGIDSLLQHILKTAVCVKPAGVHYTHIHKYGTHIDNRSGLSIQIPMAFLVININIRQTILDRVQQNIIRPHEYNYSMA